jgi:hypothetical protein
MESGPVITRFNPGECTSNPTLDTLRFFWRLGALLLLANSDRTELGLRAELFFSGERLADRESGGPSSSEVDASDRVGIEAESPVSERSVSEGRDKEVAEIFASTAWAAREDREDTSESFSGDGVFLEAEVVCFLTVGFLDRRDVPTASRFSNLGLAM